MEFKKVFLCFLLMFLFLPGCAPVRPIRELRIVETMGCDLLADGPAVSIAAEKPRLRLTQTAPSLRLAQDRLRDQAASGALFFAHTQFLLVGQAMAEADLAPALDLMARSADMRLRTPMVLLQNASAAEAVQAGDEERSVTNMLAALRADAAGQGGETIFSCAETLAALADRGAALAAACTLEDDTLRPAGYGVLKDGRCVGWITLPEARAVQLLRGQDARGDVHLDGATVTLSGCGAEYHPRWDDETLAGLDIVLNLRAVLTETDGRRDETTKQASAALEAELAATVKDWCEDLLRRSQALGADYLDLAGRIRTEDGAKWRQIAPKWGEVLPALTWSVTVEAALDRTLDLEAPVPPGGTK